MNVKKTQMAQVTVDGSNETADTQKHIYNKNARNEGQLY